MGKGTAAAVSGSAAAVVMFPHNTFRTTRMPRVCEARIFAVPI